jgi:hypothetical protein
MKRIALLPQAVASTPEAYVFIAKDHARWKHVIERAGVKAD